MLYSSPHPQSLLKHMLYESCTTDICWAPVEYFYIPEWVMLFAQALGANKNIVIANSKS
jgi:hypothetical protein